MTETRYPSDPLRNEQDPNTVDDEATRRELARASGLPNVGTEEDSLKKPDYLGQGEYIIA
ncbi:hypothetical protein KC952_02625 [Candidatus Saccharibacteria bacterium]|nr:hypothetical protein [Candidatus Saccharibacteria bacterium]